MEQLHLEKLRADRSLAPLSLVIATFSADAGMDAADTREIVGDLSSRTRATDFVGHIADGVVAFLLPYAGQKAGEAFCAMLSARIGPSATLCHASYGEKRFDELVQESLVAGAETDEPVAQNSSSSSSAALAIKRGIDVVGAVVLLIVCSPVMLITAIAVKLSSPGPAIFRQVRVGRGGVPFEFYKFRSMRVDSNETIHREYVTKLIAGRHQEINEGDAAAPVYKLQSDSRITGVGRLIRKTSIDELPQLINVLRGDMSLVGPRPPIPYETEKYQSWHMRRLQEMRPGITGVWQVQGRSKTTFDEMVRLDLFYIRNWSLWLDVKILFKTLLVVIRRDGAD